MKKEEDDDFIAIRGFAFQFDKALLEVLKNPSVRYQGVFNTIRINKAK